MDSLKLATYGIYLAWVAVTVVLSSGGSSNTSDDPSTATDTHGSSPPSEGKIKLSQTDASLFTVAEGPEGQNECIRANFRASLFITYVATLENNKPNPEETEILVPEKVVMSGSCAKNNTFLKLTWNHGNYSIQLTFHKQSKNWREAGDKSYSVTPGYGVKDVRVTMDTRNPDDFHHALHAGVHTASLEPNHTIFWTPAKHSYRCDSRSLFTLHEYLNGQRHDEAIHNLRLEMWDVHIQAYQQENSNDEGFSTAIVCESDTLNTLPRRNAVPVIVAACLAGVIIIIVLAYVINNRIIASQYRPMPD